MTKYISCRIFAVSIWGLTEVFDIWIYTYYNCGMYVYLIATKKTIK